MRYFYITVRGMKYIKGRCSGNETDKYYIDAGYRIFKTDQDIGNNLVGINGQPKWKIDKNNKIINDPLSLSEEQKNKNNYIKLRQKIANELIDKLIDIAKNNSDVKNVLIEWIREKINE